MACLKMFSILKAKQKEKRPKTLEFHLQLKLEIKKRKQYYYHHIVSFIIACLSFFLYFF